MEETILISYLNDFIFCPVSIYFHKLYGQLDKNIYQSTFQVNGTDAHKSIDEKTYSSRKNILQGIDIFSSIYNIQGKIDLFDIATGKLIERKNKVSRIYDGYIFQLYAQFYGLVEMGYTVKQLIIHSMMDNKNYSIKLPEEDLEMKERFEKLVEKSKKFGFSIVFFTYSFKNYASINYKMDGNTLLRKKQYSCENSNEIAKYIIINKIKNQKDTIKKLRKKELIDGIINLDIQINKLITKKLNIAEIMGIEGVASKVYFNRIFYDLEWNGRQPRVKRDEINLLLDIGYTVLFNYLEGLINIYGFDTYKGNLHQEFYKRKSLICDIIEPFRPIVDYKIRKLIKLGQTKNYKFFTNNGQYGLDWRDSGIFINLILSEINEYKDIIFNYIQEYYRWIMKGAEIDKFPKVNLYNDIN